MLKGWQRILLMIIPYLIIVGIFQAIGILIAQGDFRNLDDKLTSEQEVIVQLNTLLGTFLVLWLFMRNVDKEKFVNIGLQTKNRLSDFITGILIGGVIMAMGYFLLIQLNEIQFEKININLTEILLSIFLFITVAVTEEVLLRGYVLRNLILSFNKYIALIISSIIFALMHGANPNIDFFALSGMFLAGILLGISYLYTKNLWFPIALHFSWNFFQTHFGFNVSGQDSYSLIEIGIAENNILNGGDFGFEGSIFSVIFQIIAIFFIYNYFKKYPKNS